MAAVLLCAVLLATVTGCQPPATPAQIELPHHLYIWQRVWRPAHAEALQQSHTDFSALRLLSLQYHASAQGPSWTAATPDWLLLAHDRRPLTLVLRLDGQLPQLPPADQVWQLWSGLIKQAQQQGVVIQGLEIDYDAGRARLTDYRQWLTQLRAQLPTQFALSATALPNWLAAPAEWQALCQSVTHLTLQLHSVLNPIQGLFDLPLAQRWTQQALAQPGCQFYLALPAYHAHLINTTAGIRIESETPLPVTGTRQLLNSDPATIAAYLRWLPSALTKQTQAQLLGLVWFRLPLADDRLSWPYTTLHAVRHQQPLRQQHQLQLHAEQGRYQLILHNQGNLSLSSVMISQIAAELRLDGVNCLGGDTLPGLYWQQQGRNWQLSGSLAALRSLQPDSQLSLGWLRCQQLVIQPEQR